MFGTPDRPRWRLVCHVPAGGVVTGHLHAPLPAQPDDPSSLIGVFLGMAAVLHVQLSAALGMGWIPGENHVQCFGLAMLAPGASYPC